MPSTLEILEHAEGEADVACCPDSAVATVPETPPVLELEPEPLPTHQPDLHDLELLCGVER